MVSGEVGSHGSTRLWYTEIVCPSDSDSVGRVPPKTPLLGVRTDTVSVRALSWDVLVRPLRGLGVSLPPYLRAVLSASGRVCPERKGFPGTDTGGGSGRGRQVGR